MLTIATFLWFDPANRRNSIYQFTAEHVNLLRLQVARNLSLPHRFVCIAVGTPLDLHPAIRVVPLDRRTFVPGKQYAKLMIFHPGAAELIGERILLLDLDTVVVGGLDPIVERPEDLVLWRNPNFEIPKRAFYNSSMVLVRAGSRPHLWADWTPARAAKVDAEWDGADQAWISHYCSRDEAYWDERDGVYGAGHLKSGVLPDNARIVFFPGKRVPWSESERLKHPWIAEHMR